MISRMRGAWPWSVEENSKLDVKADGKDSIRGNF